MLDNVLIRITQIGSPKQEDKIMTVFSTTLAIVSLSAVAAYAIGQLAPRAIETEIEIAAPADVVWDQLTATEAYPEWNPFVRSLTGPLVEGERLDVTIQPDGKKPMKFRPEVLAARSGEELRWLGHLGLPGLFDGEHYFILRETDRQTTVLTHGESFKGALVHVLLPLIGDSTRSGFKAMNAALKNRVEAQT